MSVYKSVIREKMDDAIKTGVQLEEVTDYRVKKSANNLFLRLIYGHSIYKANNMRFVVAKNKSFGILYEIHEHGKPHRITVFAEPYVSEILELFGDFLYVPDCEE